jgi:hypothetical protein
MRRKTAILAATVLFLLVLGITPASATNATPSQEGCFAQAYTVVFGSAIAVSCGSGEGVGYRVVAHCTTGSTFWYSLGTFVPYDFGPSVAKCEGGLLTPAAVGGYHLIAN